MLLAELLFERGEALEADFARWYPADDLRDLWRPRSERRLTLRRAAVLAAHLPPGAAVYRMGPDDPVWSHESQTLVTILDVLNGIAWGMSDQKSPRPEPNPRPGDAERERPRIEAAVRRAQRWMAKQLNRG